VTANAARSVPTSARLAIAMVIVATTVGVLPVFLLGGLAVQVRADLGLSETGLGLTVAMFFGASAVFSIPGGRYSERIGAERGILLGAVASFTCLLGIAVAARSLPILLLCVAVGGAGNGVTQPASNLALARYVRTGRHGVAFGLKQSSIPTATLLGGLAVPLVALTVGWRWAYAGGAMAAAALALWALSRPSSAVGPSKRPSAHHRGGLRSLVVLAIAGGLASAAANSLAAFLVLGGVSAGLTPGLAGITLSVGSAWGIAARLTLGWIADRRHGGALGMVTWLLVAGAAGFAALSSGVVPWLHVLGTLLGFGAGWGWPGLFNLAIVRSHPEAPAAATGVTQTGVYAGGVLGPPAFGLIVETASYRAAWLAAAAALLLAAGLIISQAQARARGAQLGTSR